jgi:hypothetical protein
VEAKCKENEEEAEEGDGGWESTRSMLLQIAGRDLSSECDAV